MQTVSSTGSYNDGTWHHLAASFGAAGVKLYVDGALVATNAGTTVLNTTGYWRVGGDQLTGWSGEPSNPYFTGTLDEAAAFTTQLTDADIAAHYASTPAAVQASNPVVYWRLNDASFATAVADSSSTADTGTASLPAFVSGVTGPMKGAQPATTALHFNGVSNAWLPAKLSNPLPFTVECWFRTGTTTGGVLINFGGSRTSQSSSRDRYVYLSDDGKLNFGVYVGGVRTIRTAASYNDNTWHYVLASGGPAGLRLAVDGVVRTNDATVTSAENATGSWRLGGDAVGGWTNSPTNAYFTGDLAEFAYYPAQLTDQQMREHFHADH